MDGSFEANPTDPQQRPFDTLEPFTLALSSFTRQFKDLETHLLSLDASITDRLTRLQSITTPEVDQKPGPPHGKQLGSSSLQSICEKMDGKGLLAYLLQERKFNQSTPKGLTGALCCAPDPAKLVLDFLHGCLIPRPADQKRMLRLCCMETLESLRSLSPEIKPVVKDEARKLVAKWRRNVSMDGKCEMNGDILAFLQVLGIYQLIDEFGTDRVLELVVKVCRMKKIASIFQGLGLMHKVPDIIAKLVDMGRQLDAIKFLHSLNLLDKHPPLVLMRSFLKDAQVSATKMCEESDNSIPAKIDAIDREHIAIKTVLGLIKELNLDLQPFAENLRAQIDEMQQEKQKLENEVRRKGKCKAPKKSLGKPMKNSMGQWTEEPETKRPRLMAPVTSSPVTHSLYARKNEKPWSSSTVLSCSSTAVPWNCSQVRNENLQYPITDALVSTAVTVPGSSYAVHPLPSVTVPTYASTQFNSYTIRDEKLRPTNVPGPSSSYAVHLLPSVTVPTSASTQLNPYTIREEKLQPTIVPGPSRYVFERSVSRSSATEYNPLHLGMSGLHPCLQTRKPPYDPFNDQLH